MDAVGVGMCHPTARCRAKAVRRHRAMNVRHSQESPGAFIGDSATLYKDEQAANRVPQPADMNC